MRPARIFTVVVALSVAGNLCAEEWSEFRGPTGQGLAKGSLPTEWGPSKNVTWKKDIPGTGWSSPVLSESNIFLTYALEDKSSSSKDLSLHVICLNAKTGSKVWDKEVIHQAGNKVPRIHGKNSNASPTPIVDGSRLYVLFGHLGSACLDLKGNVLWRNTEVTYSPVHGNGGSPILVDGLFIYSIDGADKQCVVALNAKDGKVKWQADRKSKATKKFSFSTPLLIEVNGQKQIISPGSDVVTAIDAKSGEEVWRVRYTGYSVIPRPVYGNGMLFLSTSYDKSSLLAIRADGKGDVSDSHIAWTMKKDAPHTPSPLLDGDLLYVVSDRGVATCLDAKSGDVIWSERLEGNFSASPILADGKIYFQSEDGVGYVVKAGKTFDLLAKNDLKERTLASYAVADGAIFLRSAEHLFRIEKRK